MNSKCVLLANVLVTLSLVHGQLQPGLSVPTQATNEQEPFLLFSAWNAVMRMSLNGSNPVELLTHDIGGITQVDYHFRRNTIYYLTDSPSTLMSHSLFKEELAVGQDGEDEEKPKRLKANRQEIPAGLAVDWINDKVYWADRFHKTIQAYDIITEQFSKVVDLKEIPQGLSIFPYPNDTYLFVTTRADPTDPHNSKLYRIKADGTDITDLTHSQTGPIMNVCATACDIDRTKCKVSWLNECGNMVEEAWLDGSSPYTVLEDVGHSSGLSQYNNEFYYTQNDRVYKSRPGSEKVSIYRKTRFTLEGLTVVHPSKQPEASELRPIGECSSCEPGFQGPGCQDVNECSGDAHGCEHACENTEGSYSCTCNPGFSLHDDQRTCIEIPPTTVSPTTEEVTTESSTQTTSTPALTTPVSTTEQTTTSISTEQSTTSISTEQSTTSASPTTISTTQAEATTPSSTNAQTTKLSTQGIETTNPTTQPSTTSTTTNTEALTTQAMTLPKTDELTTLRVTTKAETTPTDGTETTPTDGTERLTTTGSGGNSPTTVPDPSRGPGGGLNSNQEGHSSGVLIVISVSVVVFLVLIVASLSYVFLVLFKYHRKRRGSYNVRKRGSKRDSMDPLTRISYRSYVDYHPSSRPAADNTEGALMGSLSVESFERMSIGNPFFVPPRPSPGPSVQSDQPVRILVTEAEIPPPSMAEVVNLDSRTPSDTMRTAYSTEEREIYFSL